MQRIQSSVVWKQFMRETDRFNLARRDLLKGGASLIIAALWGKGPALTQEKRVTDTKKPNTLPGALTYDDVRAVSPALEHYTKGPLLDGLWKRPDLSPRDRSVITVSALIARIQTIEMPFHFALALDNGVKASELSEIITHLAFYAGWANAMSAIAVAKDIFHQRGIGIDQLPPAKDKLLPLNEESETRRASQVSNRPCHDPRALRTSMRWATRTSKVTMPTTLSQSVTRWVMNPWAAVLPRTVVPVGAPLLK